MIKKLTALLIALLLLVSCSAAEKPLTAAELLDLGEKYLLELDYEQALVQFTKVIEIEPMNPRGYTGAAEAYVGLGDTDNAMSVLKSGFSATDGNEIIQAQIDKLSSLLNPATLSDSHPDETIIEFSAKQLDGGYVANGENINVIVNEGRNITVTISDIVVNDAYMVNHDESDENMCEYNWSARMFAENYVYEVATSHWASNADPNQELPISEFQHSVWNVSQNGGRKIGNAKMEYTPNSITWSFSISGEYDFDFGDIYRLLVNVYDVHKGTTTNRIYEKVVLPSN